LLSQLGRLERSVYAAREIIEIPVQLLEPEAKRK
jgi:hypothetical protein